MRYSPEKVFGITTHNSPSRPRRKADKLTCPEWFRDGLPVGKTIRDQMGSNKAIILIYLLVMLLIYQSFFSTGCSSTAIKKPFGVSDLEGVWAGEWISGNFYNGNATITIKKGTGTLWECHIDVAEPGLPKIVVMFNEINPQHLEVVSTTDDKGNAQFFEDAAGKKFDIHLVGNLGEAKARFSYNGNNLVGQFSVLSMQFEGSITLERKQ